MSDDLVTLFFAGLVGAAFVAPNPTEREAIKNYDFLIQTFENKKRSLGEIIISKKILEDNKVSNILKEAFQMYLNGFNKGSSLLCIALLECKLRDMYGLKTFEELITKASEIGLLTKSDVHYLNGLRVDRNFLAHNIFAPINENDVQITFKLVVRILNKIYN